ncbi:MAG: acetyl-CoA decarbonylase/synthase complex subunit gamma [Vulcanimicrobiota bacterium]
MVKLALSGMQIFNLLPKTNCKDCGSPSCLTFAMKVAAGKAGFEQCPHLSEESRQKLEELMEPPIVEIKLQKADKSLTLGGEKVIYRHDESFYNPTALAVEITPDTADINARLDDIQKFSMERVGKSLDVDMIALDMEKFDNSLDILEMVYNRATRPLCIRAVKDEHIEKIISLNRNSEFILWTNLDEARKFVQPIKDTNIALAVEIVNTTTMGSVGEFFRNNQIKKGLFGLSSFETMEDKELLYKARFNALAKKDRKFGFPSLYWSQNREETLFNATKAILKYGAGAIIKDESPARLMPILTLRQDIYTDPRRPIQVEAKLYQFGQVNADSPVMVTTNFSLTYFTVSQEIEASRVPAHLLVIDTDGTSVLTAWAADRFNLKTIRKGVEEALLEERLSHKEIILPGYVAELKEDFEEDGSWKAVAGPREASQIPEFLKLYRTRSLKV